MEARSTAIVFGDLQNNFLHPDGAYAREGLARPWMGALPARLAPLANTARANGILTVATLFTLVPGRGGEPIISPDLARLRPFLKAGDFVPGEWNHRLVDELGKPDITIEKIAYSAFHLTRLEWVLRKLGIERIYFSGIVTNVGVTTTLRDAHAREFECTIIEDGCAAFREEDHETAIRGIRAVARVVTVADAIREFEAS